MSIAVSRAWAGAQLHRATRRATRTILSALALLAPLLAARAQDAPALVLARDGRTSYAIALPSEPSPAESLAASELAAYLTRITGADFPIVRGATPARAIVIATGRSDAIAELSGEAYSIARRGERLHLTGGSPRAVLYATYDLLARLGCRWLAPELPLFAGDAERIPRAPTLVYAASGDVTERPAFAIRTIDVAQAASQDSATLRRIVEWMPKLRFNTLRVTTNHGGNGRVMWDNWRAALTPELERRGLVIEVGGHGYQNFLSAEMENGALFARHPEWFGRDSSCARSPAEHLVFDTENEDAVAYLLRNVVDYVAARPEIDVFDFWPPDGARWAECAAWASRGSPGVRQARLVVRLHEELKRARPDLRLEMIAYAHALEPPASVTLPPDILVEFCPIDQSFDAQIFDPSNPGNRGYVEALRRWREAFPGDIGVYTYYRKYAWRSLPNVIPHYIQRDLAWYASVPVQGIATYAEPADWFTYELNHLATGTFAWDPQADADSLVRGYLEARFGDAVDVAAPAYAALEDAFRLRGSIPFSAQDSPDEIAAARAAIDARLRAVRDAGSRAREAQVTLALERLALMLDFAARDLRIQESRARGTTPAALDRMVQELVGFLSAHGDRGVFLTRNGDLARYRRHYTRESRIAAAAPAGITLARDGRTAHVIRLEPEAAPAESLAAAELSSYLGRITGADFRVVRERDSSPAIVLRVDSAPAHDERARETYSIVTRGDDLLLTGGSPRAVLFAAYDLLERLGCEWLAPDFDFYAGRAELVPRSPTLVYSGPPEIVERPTFTIRKLDVEEGLSHDEETLRRIVAWMPKARYNTLMVPMDYGGRGRVRWDAWREALVPELERRDLIVEVGGHGYQNFLGAEMEGGSLFARHPDWFGRDSACRPSRAEHLVFDTENEDAVAYLVGNVVDYVAARPELDIFDFWPPDGARWAECAAWEARGTPADRQARLVVAVDSALRRVRPDLRLEMIAYAHAKEPPRGVRLPSSVLVDICPIGQNFDVQIDDPAGHNNAIYVRTIRDWRERHDGPLGIYTYYRKYAWRSLPIVLPHYMQRDMRWYASVPMQGVSTYAEPGDWATYELNHFVLGRLAWNPEVDVDALVARFAAARYGAAASAAIAALRSLEDVYRLRASIPYSAPDSAAQLDAARREIASRLAALPAARADDPSAADLRRLALMLEFGVRDLTIQHARASGAPADAIAGQVQRLVAFLGAHAREGVFLVRDGDLARYQRHYAREGLVVEPAPEPGA